MLGTDRTQEALPVSLIFDRVVQANNQALVRLLAKSYVQHEHFKDERSMLSTLVRRFDEITDDAGKKNWALFCLQVLLKKEYNSLSINKKAIDTLAEKTEAIPEFQFGVQELRDLLKFKAEEFRLQNYVDWIFSNKDQMIHAVYAHTWYFESPRFIKEFIRQGMVVEGGIQLVGEGLLLLSRCQPELFGCYSVRKLLRILLPILPESQALVLKEAIEKNFESSGSRIQKSTSLTQSGSQLIRFDTALKLYVEKKEDTPAFQLFAEDLAARSAELFLGCRLNDFERLNFSKHKGYNINFITTQFNQISEFVKHQIIAYSDKKKKARAISFFINLANETHRKSDHHSTFAILSALESADVSNPKEVWDLIDIDLAGKEKFLVDRFSPINNYRNFRAFILTYERLGQFYIPFLGPYLTELTFAHEGNPDFKETESGEKLVNFDKVKMIGAMLQRLFLLQSKLELRPNRSSDLISKIEEFNLSATP